jgi:hypothetical protein
MGSANGILYNVIDNILPMTLQMRENRKVAIWVYETPFPTASLDSYLAIAILVFRSGKSHTKQILTFRFYRNMLSFAIESVSSEALQMQTYLCIFYLLNFYIIWLIVGESL